MKIYCITIISTYFNPNELKVSPKDQIYTMPSHLRTSDASRRKDMQIHTDLKLSDLEIMLTSSNSVYATQESHRCSIHKVFRTRLLTLVQVGDWRWICWRYAQEAIIKVVIIISLCLWWMFTSHAIIVLTGNINTCVICKHKRVPSKASC